MTASGTLPQIQLAECIDLLRYMDMIAVCNIILIRYARNDSETLLEALWKTIGRGFHGRTVYGIADMLCLLPSSLPLVI